MNAVRESQIGISKNKRDESDLNRSQPELSWCRHHREERTANRDMLIQRNHTGEEKSQNVYEVATWKWSVSSRGLVNRDFG